MSEISANSPVPPDRFFFECEGEIQRFYIDDEEIPLERLKEHPRFNVISKKNRDGSHIHYIFRR